MKYLVRQQVAQRSMVTDSSPGLLPIVSQFQQQRASMQVEVTFHLHENFEKIIIVAAGDAAQHQHRLIKPERSFRCLE